MTNLIKGDGREMRCRNKMYLGTGMSEKMAQAVEGVEKIATRDDKENRKLD
jgi:hypothetical protein